MSVVPMHLLMASVENPMAYLIAFGLKKVEKERPELATDSKYMQLNPSITILGRAAG